MYNIKLIIAYDGTQYLGWQRTKMGPSIEESLEKALFQIFHCETTLQAASRTDRGVHAEGQVVNFFLPLLPDLEKLKKGLNALLPRDVAVLQIERVADSFHPTLDCLGKEYHYQICNTPFQLPFQRTFSWHFPLPLDLEKMQKASAFFIGTHDFAAFSNERREDTTRTIESLTIVEEKEKRLRIEIVGDHFLYKMVRNIVGTLVYVGCGKLPVEEIPSILRSRERKRAGVTAPSEGLSLKRVIF